MGGKRGAKGGPLRQQSKGLFILPSTVLPKEEKENNFPIRATGTGSQGWETGILKGPRRPGLGWEDLGGILVGVACSIREKKTLWRRENSHF